MTTPTIADLRSGVGDGDARVAEIAESIAGFLRTETNLLDPTLLNQNTNLFQSGLVDSLMMVSLIGFCEQTFECELRPEDLVEENLETPFALAKLLSASRAQ